MIHYINKLCSKTKSIPLLIFITFFITSIHFHIYNQIIIGTPFSHDFSYDYFQYNPYHMSCNEIAPLQCTTLLNFQVISTNKTISTSTAMIWFLPSVYFLMNYQVISINKTISTCTAMIWFLPFMYSLMN